MRIRKGSITIFAALSIMLVASMLLALLEAARVHGLDYYAKEMTAAGVESVCAEYQPLLWQDYHLLVLDGSYGNSSFSIENVNDRITYYTEKNLQQNRTLLNLFGVNLFQLSLAEVKAEKYQLLTDGKGEVFLNLISETMKETLPETIAQGIYAEYQTGKALEEEGANVSKKIKEAEDAMKDITPELSDEKEEDKKAFAENLKIALAAKETLKEVSKVQESGWLKQVMKEEQQVSKKSIDLSGALENRTLHQGTAKVTKQADWYRKVLVLEYLEKYFSCYLTTSEGRAFDYEMEYLIAGDESEINNLETVVKSLLAIREAANIIYILGNKEMMAIADTIANAVAALCSGNQAVGMLVKVAIVGAWAYLESVLDVRMLLSGGKISLLKEDEEWTTDAAGMIESFQKNAKAKECEEGLTYQEYLKQILFFMGNQKLAYRMLNVMEQNLRQQAGYSNCHMDDMILEIHYQIDYKAEPLFSRLVTIGNGYNGQYRLATEMEFSYVP